MGNHVIADLAAAGWRVTARRSGRYDLEMIAAPGQMHSRGIAWDDVVRHWRGCGQRTWRQMPLVLTDVDETVLSSPMILK